MSRPRDRSENRGDDGPQAEEAGRGAGARVVDELMQYGKNILLMRSLRLRVAIEFNIPNTAKRVDFIISGLGERDDRNAIIVELKQWSQVESIPSVEQLLRYNPEAEVINVPDLILGQGPRRDRYSPYQATSYRTLISDYNVNVQELPIRLNSCAYLHNYRKKGQDPLFMPTLMRCSKSPPLCAR